MNPRLSILERQLNRSSVDLPTPGDPQAKMMTSYRDACERDAKAATQLVQDKLDAALSEIASLKAQVSEAGKEHTRTVKEYGYKIDALKDSHKKDLEGMAQKQYDQGSQIHTQLEAKARECAIECQAKVKAETELAGANKMIARLEQSIAKLQAELKAKPVVMPNQKRPVSFTTKITQRDEDGRMVSTITTPNFEV